MSGFYPPLLFATATTSSFSSAPSSTHPPTQQQHPHLHPHPREHYFMISSHPRSNPDATGTISLSHPQKTPLATAVFPASFSPPASPISLTRPDLSDSDSDSGTACHQKRGQGEAVERQCSPYSTTSMTTRPTTTITTQGTTTAAARPMAVAMTTTGAAPDVQEKTGVDRKEHYTSREVNTTTGNGSDISRGDYSHSLDQQPMFHHPSPVLHDSHPLNQLSFQQPSSALLTTKTSYFAPLVTKIHSMNNNNNSSNSNDSGSTVAPSLHPNRQQLQQQHLQQRPQMPQERKIVLSNPPPFTRIQKSSSAASTNPVISVSHHGSPPKRGRVAAAKTTSSTTETRVKGLNSLVIVDEKLATQLEAKASASVSTTTTTNTSTAATSETTTMLTTYESLLKQIAAQRAKLNLLQTGAQTLSQDLVILDETLEEEQDSREAVVQDAEMAVIGWQATLKEYSRCEPVEILLRERPGRLAMVIESMSWQDKKILFEQIVANCRPRESYQLQYQITTRHGQVVGFDLLDELPWTISRLIMMYLSFMDLASCRMVSNAWKMKATTLDVVSSAIRQLTYRDHSNNNNKNNVDDAISLESTDHSLKNWNQLCRYHERNSRWYQGKPASMHTLLGGHSSYVTSLKKRGLWIVSGGYDEKVRLWESTTGKCARIWEVDSAVSCVELLVDPQVEGGGVVVAAFVDIGLVKVWSLHGPLNMQTLTGHQKGVRALAINEVYLVTAGFDQTVLVWEWSTGRKVASFRAHNEVCDVINHGPSAHTTTTTTTTTTTKILGVHLSKHTVFTFCIDATLRVFDIPSKTLLHQVKLFEVQHGASVQWSSLTNRMLLTATNKKVYVWQLEHLESLVQLQRQSRLSYHSTTSTIETVVSDHSGTTLDGGRSLYLDIERETMATPSSRSSQYLRPRSPSYSNTSLQYHQRQRRTQSCDNELPLPVTLASHFTASTCRSSYFYNYSSDNGSSSPPSLPLEPSHSIRATAAYATAVETRVKPCLTAVLNMTMDMWCGKVTHHDPPLLIMGSRSSPIKLTVLPLTRDIINPSRVYTELNPSPVLLSPKSIPVQGMPAGHGKGVMCIDADAKQLVVGCTGGSIQIFNMDPARTKSYTHIIGPSKMGGGGTSTQAHTPPSPSPPVITLPHLTPTQMDSIRTASPIHPGQPNTSPRLIGASTTTSATITAAINTTSSSATTNKFTSMNRSKSSNQFTTSPKRTSPSMTAKATAATGLPSPEHSPRKKKTPVSIPVVLAPPARGLTMGSMGVVKRAEQRQPVPPPSECEEQEVLVNSDEDDHMHGFLEHYGIHQIEEERGEGEEQLHVMGVVAEEEQRRLSARIQTEAVVTMALGKRVVEDDRKTNQKTVLLPSFPSPTRGSSIVLGSNGRARSNSGLRSAASGSKEPASPHLLFCKNTTAGNSSSSSTATAASNKSQPLFSKFISKPSSMTRNMMTMRRRATGTTAEESSRSGGSSDGSGEVIGSTNTRSGSGSGSGGVNTDSKGTQSLIRGRNRSDPNLLSKAYQIHTNSCSNHNNGSSSSSNGAAGHVASVTKSITKNWSLSSPWNSPTKRATKNKAA
ncbi:hypothetical protein EDD11_007592 [Mortierella claussenii]|nr:hypothetical protein EDD11_007592 [Mortierella claussenii]